MMSPTVIKFQENEKLVFSFFPATDAAIRLKLSRASWCNCWNESEEMSLKIF